MFDIEGGVRGNTAPCSRAPMASLRICIRAFKSIKQERNSGFAYHGCISWGKETRTAAGRTSPARQQLDQRPRTLPDVRHLHADEQMAVDSHRPRTMCLSIPSCGTTKRSSKTRNLLDYIGIYARRTQLPFCISCLSAVNGNFLFEKLLRTKLLWTAPT